jgi:phage tail sheath protein FI
MPITPTYPGVYIEEIPSGVRTIVGVSTSITAFIGSTLLGPTDDPTDIGSYADFENVFGGVWEGSTVGPAVRDFYLNGGRQAMIVRLYHPEENRRGRARLPVREVLTLEAAYPGAWGNSLRARVERSPQQIATEVASSLGLEALEDPASENRIFDLIVRDTRRGLTERHRNVTVVESQRRVDSVLENESRLVRWGRNENDQPLPLPGNPPTSHPDPEPGDNVWESDQLSDKVVDEASDGTPLVDDDFIGQGKEAANEGLYALKKTDLFNILCIPPYKNDGQPPFDNVDEGVLTSAARYCEDRRAFLLVDPPRGWSSVAAAKDGVQGVATSVGSSSKNAALFFPSLRQANPLHDNQIENFAPCGAVAGIFARTDRERGVFKAPAGTEARLANVRDLSVPLTDFENGLLNPLGVNCLRAMPAVGPVVWGARTLQGDDRLASEWKYIPIRRLALYIEESLYRGTQWVVFEPNDEPLWGQIRLNVGAFMHNLFRQGAFQGASPRDAYFVKCDGETTTQTDRNLGIVNILVGFAPLKPAEFVIIKIQQIAGEIET